MGWISKTALASFALALLLCGGAGEVAAQATPAEESARQAAALARLPQDAAKRLFGLETTPSPGPARSIGSYTRGCLAGAVPLPPDGPNWQVMRQSRNRGWGHPMLISTIETLSRQAAAAGWPGLLIGDVAQPRGGPMLTDHASHQLGLEADIWLMPMPDHRLSATERDQLQAPSLVAAGGLGVDPAVWGPQYRPLLETAARQPGVTRIFVNAAIKHALCREAGADRDWLNKLRPWWGHAQHFHMRLACPPGDGECQGQAPPPAGDGCGSDLAWWFTPKALHPGPAGPGKPLRLADMPAPCAALVTAP